MRRTKIVCTIGPACSNETTLEKMIRAGMDVARINFSHGDKEEHKRNFSLIRKVSKKVGKPVAVLQDLSGPKIRLSNVPEDGISVKSGDELIFDPTGKEGLSLNYVEVLDELSGGERIIIGDGDIELKAVKRDQKKIVCEILSDGKINPKKGVTIAGKSISVKALTEKDIEDALFGAELGVDMVALSFVRDRKDIQELRDVLREKGKDIPIIAKIERIEALRELDNILRVASGIMVARGDLGLHLPLEEVPIVQKMIIKKANEVAKPVITATQMLESMVHSKRPTRAEVSDVANAIFDGTDAVMLSEETAVGDFPDEAVKMIVKVAKRVEEHIDFFRIKKDGDVFDIPSAISKAACNMSDSLGACAIVTPTQSGYTARLISRCRPRCPIIAITGSISTFYALNLSFGVLPYFIDEPIDYGRHPEIVQKIVKDELKIGSSGDLVIVTSGTPKKPKTTDYIKAIVLD